MHFYILHVKSLPIYLYGFCLAYAYGLSTQDLLKDANMIIITQFMLIELADEFYVPIIMSLRYITMVNKQFTIVHHSNNNVIWELIPVFNY